MDVHVFILTGQFKVPILTNLDVASGVDFVVTQWADFTFVLLLNVP